MSGSKQFGPSEDFPQMSPSAGKPIFWFNPGGPRRFIDLTDTFLSYAGRAGKILMVKADGKGITTAEIDSPAVLAMKDKNFIHTQAVAATLWTISHNLGKYPSVRIKDSTGALMIGDIVDVSINQLTIEFSSAQSGAAIIN